MSICTSVEAVLIVCLVLNCSSLFSLDYLLASRGQMEKSSTSQEFPIAKAASSFLQETLSSSFGFPGWNRGRIVCQRTQLKKVLSGIESSSEGSKNDRLVILSNSPFSPRGTRISQRNDNPCTEAKERKKRELVTSKA